MDEPFDHPDEQPESSEPEEEHAPPPAAEPEAESAGLGAVVARLRSASFGVARRGYDRRQVDEFLSRLARRLEADTSGFDPDALKRQLQQVGESTTGILTAAEETARALRSDAAREADGLRRSAAEAAERLRTEATEYAQATRERAAEEARRLRMEATEKAEQAVAAAEHKAEDLLERSLEQRQLLEARITRLYDQRAGIVDRLRELSADLASLAEADADREPDLEPEDEHDDQHDQPRRPVEDFGFDDEPPRDEDELSEHDSLEPRFEPESRSGPWATGS